MSKIGILGGSFNPPHKGHRAMARAACEQYGIQTLYVLPNSRPPHKSYTDFVADEHRVRMTKLMIESLKDGRYRFSDFELKQGGVSYTWQTLSQWKKDHPEDELYFIIGGDSLEAFDTWREPAIISKHATILAAPRADMTEKELKKLCKERSKQYEGAFLPLSIKPTYAKISSTAIRKGKKDDWLTSRVRRYVELHGLYGRSPLTYDTVPTEKDLLKCLRATLRPKRYRHTMGVADTAEILGNLYNGADATLAERARLAGLLHDCAKYYTNEEQIALCDTYGIALTQTERENPSLIHGKLGAYLAEQRYGVSDEEIQNAIRFHTVGRPEMTTLEKIIYIADYIEPGRVIPEALHPLDDLRTRVMHDLDGTLVLVIENTIDYLKKTGRTIDEASMATLSYYKGGNHE
ncbi:MAG: nicotinate (nicotinamide) nucleotide adenylyltransferase [Eubacterium sp.]|nr:nicotinate (nicotinamide) nucleotide adenylyltransferase [Eubacterium sp.]